MKRRVVITGLGVVSPIGTGVEKFWSNLVAGVSGIDIIKRFDPVEIGLSVHIAGEVKDFEPEKYFDKKDAQKVSDFIKFAVAAADEAIKDSGLLEGKFDPYRVGDDIEFDVKGAQDAGIRGVLVKTGKFRPEDLKKSIEPFAILESVADLPRFLSNINSL